MRHNGRVDHSLPATLIIAFLFGLMPVQLARAQGKLVIAIQPTLSSDEMLKKAKPLERFIKDGLGGKPDVQIYVPTSFAAVVESLRFGHAHVAFMSAWPAQLAVQLGGAEVALAEIREVCHVPEKLYKEVLALNPGTRTARVHSLSWSRGQQGAPGLESAFF
jgi:ABC-type phosphate/phosphonate transport system substrate-binding protein